MTSEWGGGRGRKRGPIIETARHWGGRQDVWVQGGPAKGGKAELPQKHSLFRMEGVGTSTVVDRENLDRRRGNPISSMRNSKIIRWFAISYQDSPHQSPPPSTTSRTGWAGQTLKRRDVGQAVRGGKEIVRQSVGKAGRRTAGDHCH